MPLRDRTAADWLLFLRACALLTFFVLRIRLAPARSLLRSPLPASLPTQSSDPVPRIVRAVATAARFIPGATCLPQAVTARSLLSAHGIASDLKIGVDRTPAGILAHAWLERDGVVLIGGAESPDRFAALSDPDSRC